MEVLTSVTLTRDLYMYSGPEMRVALHAHALVSVLTADRSGGRLSSAHLKLALRILYSIRSHWGARACAEGKYVELLTLLFDWRALNEAAGVASPVQLLLALCAFDWEDVVTSGVTEKLSVPVTHLVQPVDTGR